ncbi:MAG: hypothetical protein V7677_10480 [Motiliproteus sp.]
MSDERLCFETAPYEELCGCVSVHLTDREQKELKFADSRGRREVSMRKWFKTDKQRTYLADCPNCDTGIKLI